MCVCLVHVWRGGTRCCGALCTCNAMLNESGRRVAASCVYVCVYYVYVRARRVSAGGIITTRNPRHACACCMLCAPCRRAHTSARIRRPSHVHEQRSSIILILISTHLVRPDRDRGAPPTRSRPTLPPIPIPISRTCAVTCCV